MPSVLAKNATSRNQTREPSGRQQPSTDQVAVKKMPHSEKSVLASQAQPTKGLDDVTFLRLPEVKAITGLSKSSLYALIQEKQFPAPVRLGMRAVAWIKSEVRQWAMERIHASRSAA